MESNIRIRIKVLGQIWSLTGTLSHMVRASKDVEHPYLVFYASYGIREYSLEKLEAWSLLWAAENTPGLGVSFTTNGARMEIREDLLVW